MLLVFIANSSDACQATRWRFSQEPSAGNATCRSLNKGQKKLVSNIAVYPCIPTTERVGND